jgi:hypothetical protein
MDNDDSWEETDKTNLIALVVSLGIPTVCMGCCFLYWQIRKYIEYRKFLSSLKENTKLKEVIIENSFYQAPSATQI